MLFHYMKSLWEIIKCDKNCVYLRAWENHKENKELRLLDIPSISIQSSAQLEPISDSSPVSATLMDMESDAEHSEYWTPQ